MYKQKLEHLDKIEGNACIVHGTIKVKSITKNLKNEQKYMNLRSKLSAIKKLDPSVIDCAVLFHDPIASQEQKSKWVCEIVKKFMLNNNAKSAQFDRIQQFAKVQGVDILMKEEENRNIDLTLRLWKNRARETALDKMFVEAINKQQDDTESSETNEDPLQLLTGYGKFGVCYAMDLINRDPANKTNNYFINWQSKLINDTFVNCDNDENDFSIEIAIFDLRKDFYPKYENINNLQIYITFNYLFSLFRHNYLVHKSMARLGYMLNRRRHHLARQQAADENYQN